MSPLGGQTTDSSPQKTRNDVPLWSLYSMAVYDYVPWESVFTIEFTATGAIIMRHVTCKLRRQVRNFLLLH